jgi:hypothetical protein
MFPTHSGAINLQAGRLNLVQIDWAYRAGATSFVARRVNWRLLVHQVRYVLRAHRAMGLGLLQSQVA